MVSIQPSKPKIFNYQINSQSQPTKKKKSHTKNNEMPTVVVLNFLKNKLCNFDVKCYKEINKNLFIRNQL